MYKDFGSKGEVCLGSNVCDSKPVVIYRDTSAAQSLMLPGVVRLDAVSTEASVLVQAIDPFKDELAKFEKIAKDNEKKWQNVKFDFQATTIEEYLEKEKNTMFGLIVVSHSAYHFNDIEGTLAQLYNDKLIKGGIFFTKMVSGAWEKILQKVGEYYYDPKLHFLGSETLTDILRSQIPDIKLEIVRKDNLLNVTECFDEKSEEGGLILDGLTQVYNFRNFCKPGIKKTLMEYFENELCNKEGDTFLFNAGEEYLIAFRP
ncbi:histamine N-methyltransferase-like [Saccoglossus kowalevskii]